MYKNQSAFTLIELLIVVGILASLAMTTVLILDPIEMSREGRDSIRLNDLNSLHTALGLFSADKSDAYIGDTLTVYVSIPDTSSTCDNLTLPSLPLGWSYACQTEADYKKVDGNGWIPIDFSSSSYGSPFSVLPVDPINSIPSHYFTYVTGGSWEMTALLESDKHKIKAGTDGGFDPAMYEIGTDLSLSPFIHQLIGSWMLDDGSGTTADDSSGNDNTGTLTNGPLWVSGKISGALNFDGINDYLDCSNIDLAGSGVTVSWWMNVIDNSGLTESDNLAPVVIDWMKGSGSDYRDGTILCYMKTNPGWSGGNYATNGVLCAYSSGDTVLNDVGTDFNSWYGSWHHVVYTVDGTNAAIYVNGELENDIVGVGNISPENEVFAVSQRNWNYGVNLHGTVDEVRIYNRALTAEEILAIYNATK